MFGQAITVNFSPLLEAPPKTRMVAPAFLSMVSPYFLDTLVANQDQTYESRNLPMLEKLPHPYVCKTKGGAGKRVGKKKRPTGDFPVSLCFSWSGRHDSNMRPSVPKT